MRGPQILLDITRTVSCIADGAVTGIDRIERAYIRWLLDGDLPVFFLSRVAGGVALLDRAGLGRFLAAAESGELRQADAVALITRRQSPSKRRIESTLRRETMGWTTSARLAKLLSAHLPAGFHVLNVGHTHLRAKILHQVRQAGAGRIGVLIHDMIPLDYPEHARSGTPEKFAAQMRDVGAIADLLIYNSEYTRSRALHWFDAWKLSPRGMTVYPGVDPPAALPAGDPQAHPAFVTTGTIEPRKNHLLLLALWRQFHDSMPEGEIPHLHIIGRRGWENEMVLDQLDRAPFMNRTVFEHGYLPDADMAARIADARAILFPSFAEGFGYPLMDAVAWGKPAICSDLEVFRELAGNWPTYLDPLDGPGWKHAILSAAGPKGEAGKAVTRPDLPDWRTHFEQVLEALVG